MLFHQNESIIFSAGRVSDPFIASQVNGGSVDRGTVVTLDCDSTGAKIFYTVDGAPPELHLDSAKVCSKWHFKINNDYNIGNPSNVVCLL